MSSSLQQHVVCVGDSLTAAQVSVDYIKMLAAAELGRSMKFTNAGVNGDLAFNVLQRLDSVIDLQPDAITVLIGTNDANASLSEKKHPDDDADEKAAPPPGHRLVPREPDRDCRATGHADPSARGSTVAAGLG